jgi:hypothetical protein
MPMLPFIDCFICRGWLLGFAERERVCEFIELGEISGEFKLNFGY